jgi:tetratricopeptide (TPR) repeat protein
LQKQREEEARLATLQAGIQDDQSNDEEIEGVPLKIKLNAFDLLNTPEEDDDDSEEASSNFIPPVPKDTSDAKKPANSKNKRRKRKAVKPAGPLNTTSVAEEVKLDEIDRALKELSATGLSSGITHSSIRDSPSSHNRDSLKSPEDLLAVEPKYLNSTNEMRKLFGNVVLESFDRPENDGPGRRRDRQREAVDLEKALSGRYSPASKGQSLVGSMQRKNVLMQGKDEWPRAPSGGLGMEMVEKLSNGSVVYKIIHNVAYQGVQNQFDLCVESLDPQRLIHLLQYNPYHISTLLQVSDIAKHQGDHAVSADLLERALFNIGRSAHSTFGSKLREGKAGLDFFYMENRELWLAGWRYISNLGMKGTWRTSYEWAKLLLGLDTDDPYSIKLLIDNLALRAREFDHFIELCTQTVFKQQWELFPNIQCSLALAYFHLNKQKEARERLDQAMSRYPWIFCRLAQELNIEPIPKRIRGKTAPSQPDALLSELYVARTKDLWGTPETVALMVEIADSYPENEERIDSPDIDIDIARHVILSDIRKVISHLPSHFTSQRISATDPLPPYDSEAFHEQGEHSPSHRQMAEIERWQALFERFQDDDEGSIEEGNYAGDMSVHDDLDVPDLPRPTWENQALLREWLLDTGLRDVRTFLSQYGVDRGNWNEAPSLSPLANYLAGLSSVQPDTERIIILRGPVRVALGDLASEILEEELHEFESY